MKKQTVKKSKIKLSRSDRILEIFVYTTMTLLLLVVLYPLIFVLSSSFSSGSAVGSGKVILWPVDFSLIGYKIVFDYDIVWTGYLNTLIYTVVVTTLNLIMTIMVAYPLSRKNFQGRNFYMTLYIITMFFGGGIIPSYLLMSSLHLTNTRWVLMLGGVSAYNMIIMRTFFQSNIPNELHEAAKIDGITDLGYLLKVVVPLSKTVFSVITLYYAVGHWNAYFSAMLYLRDRNLYPLQLILRDILNVSKVDLSQIDDPELLAQMQGASDVMKYALVVIATVPILILYPFVQKYFEKGVMIGSVKG